MNASDGPGHEACRARGHHTLRGSWRALDADVRRFLRETRGTGEGRVGALTRVSALTTPQGLVVLLHRLSHLLWVRGWHRLAELVHWANHLLHKVSIRPDSCLDGGLWVPHPPSVAFHGTGGRDVGLYADSACLPVDPLAAASAAEGPRLGDGVIVGTHVAVIGPVAMGDGAKLPFKIVLRADAPPGSVGASRATRARVRPARP